MKENPQFIGRKYDNTEKEQLKKVLSTWSDKSKELINGELEKTQEEIESINIVNSMISDELNLLGIKNFETIPLEKIHFLLGEIFKKEFPNFKGTAFFRSTSDVIYINKDKVTNKAELFSTLTHELLHRASTNKFYSEEKSGNLYSSRTGYRIQSPWKNNSIKHKLLGFNEMMTDSTVYKILHKNKNKLEKIGVMEKDINGPIYSYMNYAITLNGIVNGVSKYKNISKIEAFENLEKGQFQNSILVLKDIEKAFGKGSLEILSYLGGLDNKEDREKIDKLIEKFFNENEESLRKKIGQEILEFVKNKTN